MKYKGRRGRDRMVVGLTTTCAISAYHYSRCDFESRINMLQSLIDNIVVIFGGRVFQPTDGIPIGINCASLLADLFHYLYDAGFSTHQSRYEYI
jgi:hypothetical protein